MEHTKISWTRGTDGPPGSTFNPWWGCQRVSPGCEHCYAETFSKRLGKALWGPTAERQMASDSYWRQPLAWNRKAKEANARHRVFCASMADVFEDRPELREPRARLFRMIEQTPHLDWLLLTKRPQNMARLAWDAEWYDWPENVWAGTTVEDQRRAEERIPQLLSVPARVHFLSCEPLLGKLDLRHMLKRGVACECERGSRQCTMRMIRCNAGLRRISWIIVGGESGHSARPFDLDWARSIREQCKATGTAFFFKQTGSSPVMRGNRGLLSGKGDDPDEWPSDLRVQEFPR